MLGFIITRHVNSEITNKYWQKCYKCIRELYPLNDIIIIDDNSDKTFLTNILLINTKIIQSEFKGRAESLPYYYFAKYEFFNTAVILNDCVFIKKLIDFDCEKYKILWTFEHGCDQPDDEKKIINGLNNSNELLKFHSDKSKWTGCFAGMSIIKLSFIKYLHNKYNFELLFDNIKNRYNRMSFERVIGCILQYEYISNDMFMFGTIHNYLKKYGFEWGISFEKLERIESSLNAPILRVWTSR
jgi:hypothetical protein